MATEKMAVNAQSTSTASWLSRPVALPRQHEDRQVHRRRDRFEALGAVAGRYLSIRSTTQPVSVLMLSRRSAIDA